jgi:probable selenium-dependent hydroxylase accessory protein YqeC
MKVGTMKLSTALNLRFREIISFVGGGGKTSLMLRLAEEIPIGCPTLITATTKINIPPAGKYPVFIALKRVLIKEVCNSWPGRELKRYWVKTYCRGTN